MLLHHEQCASLRFYYLMVRAEYISTKKHITGAMKPSIKVAMHLIYDLVWIQIILPIIIHIHIIHIIHIIRIVSINHNAAGTKENGWQRRRDGWRTIVPLSSTQWHHINNSFDLHTGHRRLDRIFTLIAYLIACAAI